jgi:hypothetical protein
MTPLQKKVFAALAAVIALSRLFAIAKALFDWDEGLFTLAIRDYDVINHHPHPPGYPLFIAAAKLLHAIGIEEFRALQTIVVIGAMLLFPALYLFARSIGFGFATAAGGAALFCFLPNVWVYGGTGFSDIPALTLTIFACALLLSGTRRGYLVGAILLGIAAGIRPPSLVIGLVPALLATYRRLRERDFLAVIGATLLGASIVAVSYLGAAYATGSVSGYLQAVKAQSKYVRDVDSWRNPGREPLHEVAEDFFLRPVQQQLQMYGLVLLCLVSLVTAIAKRKRPPLLALAIFAPFAITAWLNLDVQAAGRYSMPYLVAYALLAADALSVIARHRVRVQAVLVAMVIVVFAVWTWPALKLQRTGVPPPIAALRWIKANVPPQTVAYLYAGLGPQVDYVLPERKTFWERPEDISMLAGDAWVVDVKEKPGALNFTWPHSNPLWKIIRRRNFEASVSRVSSFITFGPEWYSEEGAGLASYRWMPATATALLPPLRGSGKLHVRMYVPIDTLPAPPDIEVSVNGNVLERFRGSDATMEKTWTVPSRTGAPNELRITTSGVVNPAKLGGSDDSRDLGLRIDALSWNPVP